MMREDEQEEGEDELEDDEEEMEEEEDPEPTPAPVPRGRAKLSMKKNTQQHPRSVGRPKRSAKKYNIDDRCVCVRACACMLGCVS